LGSKHLRGLAANDHHIRRPAREQPDADHAGNLVERRFKREARMGRP